MPTFTYTARTRSGEKVNGSVDANDRRAALTQLSRMGYVPMSVTEGAAPKSPAKKAGARGKKVADAPKNKRFKLERRSGKPAKMKLRDVLLLSQELSDLLASGMTLGNALHTLSQRKTGKAQDTIVANLRDEIIKGSSLSEALSRRPDVFPNLYVSVVKAGEASGSLSDSLVTLCHHYEKVQAAREKVMMALTYPVIVLIIGVGTMVFSMIFVVPRFTSIFEELGSTLPLPTRMLIGASSVLTHYWWLIAAVVTLLVMGIRQFLATEAGTLWWHRYQMKIPVVKHLVTANAFAHFARTLSALLKKGVPVLQSLQIVQNTVGNHVIANEIKEARERVTDGATISKPLAEGKIFPPLLTDMLAVGEESGDMAGALGHIARRYDDELDRAVKLLTTILEPILILMMAGMVGFLAISMLLAVFDMTSGLSV